MTDIVKRLRDMARSKHRDLTVPEEAAYEIERLREALEDIADRFDLLDCELTQDARTARDIALAALKETGHD